ncbi:transglutaminase-like domain-containing protein [Roseivivax sp. CAU 1761]
MLLKIDVTLDYALPAAADCLVQIKAAALTDQRVLSETLETGRTAPRATPAEDGIGERLWVRAERDLVWQYHAEVAVEREAADIAALTAAAPGDLPPEVVKYLFPSRYCPSDKFLSFVATEYGGLTGGAQIAALRDFVARHFAYVPGASNAETSALETFVLRQGVCRDFAHMLITLARAATVPARFASVYAPGVTPPDFHAVAEVWLGGAWHLIDPTGMAHAGDMARICVGRDATDVAFLTSYGAVELRRQKVSVTAA